MKGLYVFITIGLAAIFLFSLIFYNANADISVTAPYNWQPNPENNSTNMVWFHNSTKSAFAIVKAGEYFPLSFIVPIFAQALAETDFLESTDQITIGQSNFGYRYLLNISKPLNASSGYFGTSFPFEIIPPTKMMMILTQKHGETWGIALISPPSNFDSVSKQIKPTLDSIRITKPSIDTKVKWNKYNDSALGLSLEYPSGWAEEPRTNSSSTSICDPIAGTCFHITAPTDRLIDTANVDIDLVSRELQDAYVNISSGDKLTKPVEIANYTIDGEKAGEFTMRYTIPDTNTVADQQDTIVIHNGRIYLLQFAAHSSTFNNPETKEIVEHIIKSIKWTR